MTAPTIILSAPADWLLRRNGGELQAQYGCTSVVHFWHPSLPLQAGALHLTSMHPGDLEDWGFDIQGIERHGWPSAHDRRAPLLRHRAHAQAGHLALGLSGWLGAMVLCLAVFMAQQGDLASLMADHGAEQAQADDLEAAQRAEAAFRAWLQRQQEVCGENSAWIERADGTQECTTKRGQRTGVLLAGAQP